MKNILFTIALFVAITFASPTSGQAAPQPKTATEAVFFSYGMIEAQGEVLARSLSIEAAKLERPPFVAPLPNFPFRLMASMANQMAFAFLKGEYPIGYWYFSGRAEVFNQMADMAGEP